MRRPFILALVTGLALASREGPRDQVMALIESYATVVLEMDDQTLRGLRRDS